ncbi:MAG: glycerophosphodiester phosphodiesterase [Gammaproteobacteria bacterium]|nr:glycerophosphodiester phosphodiesterase [Gammaproteobacteria bacterium]
MEKAKPLFCFAHRGYSQRATENTLQAISHALEYAIDGIEIDVWNVGGQLLVVHDRRLGRLLAGRQLITDMSPEILQQMPLPCGDTIPSLREVLELVGSQVQLNLELKGSDCAALVASELEAYVRDCGGCFEQYLVSSFDHRQLYHSLQLLPQVRRGVLLASVPLDLASCAEALQAYSVHLSLNIACVEMIEDARKRGFKNYVFTVNELEDLQLIATMGADGVFTDQPQLVIEYNASKAVPF